MTTAIFVFLVALLHGVNAAAVNSTATSKVPNYRISNATATFHPCSGFDGSASDGDSIAILGSFARKITMGSGFMHNRTESAAGSPLEVVFEMHGRREKINLSFLNANASTTIQNSWNAHLGAKVVLTGTKKGGCTLQLARNFQSGASKLGSADASGVLAAFPKISVNPKPSNTSRSSRTASISFEEAPPSVIRLTRNGVSSAPLPISGILSAAASQPQLVSAQGRATPYGDFYTAMVLVRAWDDYEDWIPSHDEARRLIFSDDADSIKTFWSKSSYGKITPRGIYSYADGYNDIFMVDVPSFFLNNICANMKGAGDEATRILLNNGVDLFAWYGSINFVISRYQSGTCDGRAFAYIPGQDAYYPMGTPDYPLGLVVKHESGHTFYLPHSSSLDCVDGSGRRTQYYSSGGYCTYDEYNDQYSIMGVATYCDVEHHGRDRFACGWLQAGTEVVDVPLQKGQHVYTLNSLDHSYTVDGSIRLLRIPLRNPIYVNGNELSGGTGNWHYYVEYRSGYTNTCGQNYRSPIVSIRLAPAPGILANSMSVDNRLDTSSVSDAPINAAGMTFVDYYQGLGVLVNKLGDNTAEIVVSIDEEPKPPGGDNTGSGSCSSALLVDKFENQNDFQTNSVGYGYATDGTGDWSYYADGKSGVWTPRSSGGGYWYTILWDGDYCRDLSGATGLRMRVAADSEVSDVSFDVGLDINNGNCGSSAKTFKAIGSVTVVGYEGWINVNLQFNGMLSADDLKRVQALVFTSNSKTDGKAIYVSDIEFVKCDQCRNIRTIDNFNDAGDLNGNDITGAAWKTDGTGVLDWDPSTSAHWRPTSADAYLYTTFWSSGYCSDFSSANSVTMNWWSDASEPVQINIGFDLLDDCNNRVPKFTLVGTVTLFSNRWTTVSLPLNPLGNNKNKISALVVKPTAGSVNKDLYFDNVQFSSCPGL
ncbi:hypothetical protein BJ742DRAFT_874556 [Cladochytrium replicatum]|nr:hypothetical protein BJ742DRAFT_874556 [Cladochytrium replicatum]